MVTDNKIKVRFKIYLIFTAMFGSLLVAVAVLSFERGTIRQDSLMIALLATVLFGIYFVLGSIEIVYNNKSVKYKTLLRVKSLKISEIKNIAVKISSNPFKPTVGLYIYGTREKSDIIVPINLFKQREIEGLINFLKERYEK